jgi:hypothetical protein
LHNLAVSRYFSETFNLLFSFHQKKVSILTLHSFLQTQNAGTLDISPKGLRVRLPNGRDSQITPFQNIAVWSAVKFVVSQSEGGAAFLPLITDPENIDKAILFKPLR